MATLDQLYVALAMICILVAIGQSIFASWLLYIRHNLRKHGSGTENHVVLWLSLLCWQPAFCRSLSLGSHGFTVAIPAGYTMGAYIGSAHGDHCLPENESAGSG